MFRTRMITALGLIVLMLMALFVFSAPLWAAFSSFIVVLALWEYSRMVKMTRWLQMGYLTLSVGMLIFFWCAHFSLPLWLHIGVLVFWLVLAPLWLIRRWELPQGGGSWFLGWFLMFPAWFALVEWRPSIEPAIVARLFALMGLVWVADSAAYFVGRFWGRRKLAQTISPGKTWEGVYGAMVAVVVYGYLVGYFSGALATMPSWQWLFFTVLLAVVSIVGDLLESWFKRCADLKDSGQILPGHGGVYDRIDSLIAVLAVGNALHTLGDLWHY